jgi:ribosome biogenesis protein Nip4
MEAKLINLVLSLKLKIKSGSKNLIELTTLYHRQNPDKIGAYTMLKQFQVSGHFRKSIHLLKLIYLIYK